MRACLLAAGSGTRLGRSEPKGFLRLGDRPIVEESLLRLFRAGISEVIVVTGFGAAHYEELAARYPGRVRCVHNERFATTGSLHSLGCAADLLDGPFLLLESDLVYEQRALSLCLEHPSPDVVLLSTPTGAGDEVWVDTTPDGLLLGMSKVRSPTAAGELVGVSRISVELCRAMRAGASPGDHYETDGLTRAAAAFPIACPVAEDLVWCEIDDEHHLERARRLVHPRLCREDPL